VSSAVTKSRAAVAGDPAKPGRKRTYKRLEVEAGLVALALWHGNARQASRTLAEQNIEIPASTLQEWKRSKADQLAELERTVVPQVRAQLAKQYEVVAMRSAEIAVDGLDRLADELHDVPIKDLGKTIQGITTAGAISVDKASLLRGLPTEIHETRSADDILKGLADRYPGLITIEGTAEEVLEPAGELPAGSNSSAVAE
jgi:hypothetical protein